MFNIVNIVSYFRDFLVTAVNVLLFHSNRLALKKSRECNQKMSVDHQIDYARVFSRGTEGNSLDIVSKFQGC